MRMSSCFCQNDANSIREEKDSDPSKQKNYLFYTGQIPSRPEGDYIDKIHMHWLYDYTTLEVHHGCVLGREEASLIALDTFSGCFLYLRVAA